MTTWYWINGNFVEAEKAVLGLNDLALQRGYGLFDFFRTRNNRPLFMESHLDRFFGSARMMHLNPPLEKDELRAVILQLIEKNKIAESGFKIILTGGYSGDTYTPTTPNLIVQQNELKMASAEQFARGIKILTYPYQRELPLAKSVNYLIGIWLQQEIKARGADEVLYYQDDIITEFPRANVFIVIQDGTLITPSRNILPGVTRKNVLEIAKKYYKVEERDISIEELKAAKEVFLTSTTRRLMPVFEIDGIALGKENPITRSLYEMFLEREAVEAP